VFPLLRHFSVASAATIAIATVLLTYVYWKTATSELVQQAEAENSNLALVLSNTVWPHFAGHIATAHDLDGDALRAHRETGKIHEELKSLVEGLPILKVKIYHPGGLTIYSSEAAQMGETKSGSEGFETAISFVKPVSKLSYRDSFSAFSGLKSNRNVVESYLPVVSDDGVVVGVFELYTDVTKRVSRIEKITTNLSLGLLAVFGVLYGVLFLVVRRADRILKTQYVEQEDSQARLRSVMSALVVANESLDQRVKERTQVLEEEIRERERAENEMRTARDEAREANDAKTQFLSSMSHELRTPLNAILGFSQLIESDPEDVPTRTQTANIGEVISAGNHLLELIEDVLDLSRIEAGAMNVDIQAVDTKEILSECVRLIQSQATARSISLIDRLPEEAIPLVAVDRRRLKQVLVNIFTNALKFNREGGSIEIASAEIGPDFLRISILDTGPGIPGDQLDAIFEPFHRSNNTRDAVDGTGIGLTIAKQLIETMGGTIGVTSTVGHGSEFWIDIPIFQTTTESRTTH